MHLSASQLSGFADCGERFRLERVEGAHQQPAWYFIGGHAIHTVFELITNNPGTTADDAEKWFTDQLDVNITEAQQQEPDMTLWRKGGRASKANPDKEDGTWWAREGAAQVRKFATVYNTPFLPGKVVQYQGQFLTEVEFLVPIGDNMVKGYIDAVIEMPDGTYRPRDYKAGSRTPASALQLGVYAEAMRSLYNVQVTHGEYLMTRTMTAHERTVESYGYDTLNRLFSKLELAKKYDIYIPNVSMLCGTCSVAHACTFGPKKE